MKSTTRAVVLLLAITLATLLSACDSISTAPGCIHPAIIDTLVTHTRSGTDSLWYTVGERTDLPCRQF
jgi:hypothetical protein